MSGTFAGFRLSPQQARLLALAQADADWPLCACALFEVEGGLEIHALKAAVETVVAQHEVLRTKIVPEPSGEGLVQVVTDLPSYAFREVCAERDVLLDGGPWAPSGDERLAVGYMREESGSVLLALRAPAFLCDGQGLRNVARALVHAYGNHGSDSEEPLLYADVAEVFCRLLESEETLSGRDHWRGRWPADALALRLPLEPPLREMDAGQPLAVVRRTLSPALAARLTALAEVQGISVESLAAACWLAVLRGLSGEPDLHLGVIVEGRDFEGLGASVGPFARCLPLRATVRAETGFRDFAQGIGRDLAMLRRFQDYFVPETPAYLPLGFAFSAGFEIAAGGLSLRLRGERSTVDRFHLQLSIFWDREAPEVALAYDGRIYGKGGVDTLAQDLLQAFERCGPSVRVSQLFPDADEPGVEAEALTPTGERVAGLWSEVFGIAGAGALDDFLALGGDSSLAVRLVSRIQSIFHVELPVRTLFEVPTVAGLAQRIDLALAAGEASEPPMEPVDRSGLLPVSFGQQRLWFLHQLEPDSPAYNISSSVVLSGGLDLAALAASLGEIVRRHEALRTVFEARDGEPRQMIRPAAPFPLPLVDLSGLAGSRAHAEAERVAMAEAARPFDLARGPLLRAAVLRLGNDENAILITMHHIVSDGWSMGILRSELRALYEAALEGRPSPLPELPLQYGDFAVWQRQWFSSPVLERGVGFWRRCLAGMPAVLELPADRPRPPVQSWLGAVRSFRLPVTLSQDLVRFGQSRKVTLFALLLAAFQGLLCRWSGQRDLSVGTPIAGRARLELENLVGLFVNTLVLRGDLSGDPGFEVLLERTWSSVLEAHAHQDVPFEKLVEELAPERSLAHSPLFQVMFVLQNLPGRRGTLHGLQENGALAGGVASPFDLTLAISESDQGLIGGLEYNTDLFDATTMARLQIHFESLLRGVVEDPGRPLSSLPLLTDWERAQVLVEWNAGALDRLDSGPRVHELFAQQAARTPEAVALVFEGGSLSYAELHRRSGRWARRLERRGVGRGSIVGICLERSPEMIEALFGTLKAGAAYLPLDPASSRPRLEFMLGDAGVSGLVARAPLRDELSAAVPWVLDPDRPDDDPADESREELQVDPEDLAYVIYTSGSTGTPRGVLVKHGSIAAYARVAARYFGLGPGDRVLQFASLAFDTSAEEIFPCLIQGGALVLRPEDLLGSASRFVEACGELGVTVLDLPTAFWHEMTSWLESGEVELPPAVRLVVIGGEQALRERLASWRRSVGDRVPLLNGYGPTEATIVATFCDLSAGEPQAAGASIGSAIPGARVFVLDPDLLPMPLGAVGELCIGGTGVARGYLGHPGLTAERFVPDPFGNVWSEPGARLYRTGDLARFLVDGRLEFLGRIDHQVKIRGFRIELGEIESALLEHGAVRAAVVVVQEEEPGHRRLTGYVVAEPAPGLEDELRAFLRSKLPEYMIPSTVATLAAFPLTVSGKVNRKALPATAPQEADRKPQAEELGPVEELVSAIWSEVLQVEEVGAGESFFDLGGHSLLATRVLSRVRAVFGRELPVRTLFETPTLAAFSRRIDQALRTEGASTAPPLERVDRNGGLPLSFAQQRMWFLQRLEPDSPAYNIASAFLASGLLDLSAFAGSLGEVVRRHEVLRTIFRETHGEPSQVVLSASPILVPLADLSGLGAGLGEAEARRLTAEEGRLPFDLGRGSLRSMVLRLGPREHVVLTTVHHIVSDGWSMDLFRTELGVLYEALRQGRPSPLPELPVQYADFAVWQRRWLSGSVLERELDVWRRRLGGMPALLELPTDRPRPAVQSWRGAVESLELPETLSRELRRVGRRREVTPFALLLAVFQILLARWSGQPDVCVGTPIAGRNRLETEALIGLFVNTLVLRGDLSGDPLFGAVLKRTWGGVLEVYAHQDLPFERLVEELAPERSLAHTPLFQVMFALQNIPGKGPDASSELKTSAISTGGGTAAFDLTLAVSEPGERLVANLEHNTDLFESVTARRLLRQLENLLRGVVEDPDRPLSALPLLSPWEEAQLVLEWNAREADRFDQGPSVQEMLAEQARRSPEAVAVVSADRWLSYEALERRSNQWAYRLRRMGAGPGTIVGLCLERSPEVIEALFGILKAGAAYLPLDPSSPAERLESMLLDAGVEVLVSAGRLGDSLAHAVSRVFDPYREAESLSAERPEALTPQTDPESLAYVIYTSGSTGTPRGVLVKHGSLAAYSRVAVREFGLGPGDRVLQFASLAFDASAEEIFPCLIRGATLVLRPDGMMGSASRFLEASGELAVSVLDLPTAFWHELVAELETGGAVLPASVRLVIIGGEQALRERVASWRRTVGDRVRLLNTYGPTEATIVATSCDLSVGSPERAPIGTAIPGVRAYVLDRSLCLVPMGAAGELCLGGAGLARGYLGRPELTAERFLPDPFGSLWEEPGARLYRTGDRARWLPEGALEYLGRLDHQVKVRGFRVELGEIETALLASGRVREAVVVLRDGEAADPRLVAYVVAPEAPGLCEDLQDFLHRKLPDYMVPSAIVRLASLPLSPTGKVDRGALPAPEAAGPARRSGVRTPHGNVEVRLLRLWGEILGTRSIGVQDDFFALGGHSLLAVRLLASLRREFGRELPLSVLFEARTVEALAQRLREGWEPQGDSLLVPIWSSGTKPPFFCVHPIGGTVFCYAELSRALGVEQPFYGLRAPQPGVGASWGIEDLAAQYITAMRRIQPRGPYALGGWSMGGVVAFEMARQLAAQGEPVSLLALIESHAASAGGGALEETLADLFVRDMADLAGFRLEGLGGDGPETGEDGLLIRLLEAGQSQGAFPRSLSFAEVRDVFLVFKRNHEALQMHTVKPYSGRAELFLAQSSLDTQEDLSAGWSGLAEGGVEVHVLPGDHYSLLREPRVGNLATGLRALLESVLTQPVGENR